jgi:hypothetical protein
MSQTLEINLKIRCYNLPGVQLGERNAVRLGIQKRQEVIEDVAADGEEANFLVPLRVEFKPTGAPDFYGPFVHGTTRERFVYLCWGERYGGQWQGFSRVKLQLLPIPPALLLQAADNNAPLEVSINMTDEKGKIICATIKEKQILWKA